VSAQIDIPAGERGRIRVFAISVPPEEVTGMLAKAPKADVARNLLGAPHLDTRSTEIFPVKDLEGLGLAQYLVEGYAVPEDSLAEDQRKLDALDGYVLLLFSDSFNGAAAQLAPGPELTLIATCAEELPDQARRPTMTPSAAPYSGALVTDPVPPPRGAAGRATFGMALIAALVLLLWWLLT
jgi:hypothetical protein